jgi:conjugative relaxase-like TrwC/TraI family protein
MLTQSRLEQATISEISKYLSRDNYYSNDEAQTYSLWHGAGANILGLDGQVESDIFQALLSGRVEGQQLGKRAQGKLQHRPGIDFTFSAPKSVSILSEVYQDRAVQAAHLAAVTQTLDYLEQRLITTRQFSGGKSQRVHTGNGIFALFTHDVSRELDPALHTHCVMLNATKTSRGWRSIPNDVFHRRDTLHHLGRLYRANLARELTRRGFSLMPNANDPSLFEVAGVPEVMIRRFSKRAEQIRTFIEERDMAYAPELAKRVALITRKRKQEVPRDELRRLWREEVQDLSFGLGHVPRKVVLTDSEVPGSSPAVSGVRSLFNQAISHLLERDMGFTETALFDAVVRFGLGRVDGNTITAEIERMKQSGGLLPAREYADGDRELWTTHDAKRIEGRLIALVREQDSVRSAYNPIAANRIFAQTTLNDQQRAAIVAALSSRSRFFAIQGDPGVGKTTALRVVKRLLHHAGYDVLGLASTYQAVGELSNSLRIQGLTVDRYLVDPNRDRFHQGGKRQAWIVDEPGMLNTEKLIELLELATQQNARVLLVGDHQQLESVGAGRGFKHLLDAGIAHQVLNKRMRQKTDYMRTVVEQVMKKHYSEALDLLQAHERILEHSDEGEAIRAISAEWLLLDREARENTLVVTPTNEQRRDVCNAIREGLVKENSISKHHVEIDVFSPLHRTTEEKRRVVGYEMGDVVRFDKDVAYDKRISIKRGEYFDVIGKNVEENTIGLRSRRNHRVIVINPLKKNLAVGGTLQLFAEERIKIAEGDKLRWLDNKNDLGIKRNTGLEVVRANSAFVRVRTEEGASIKIALERKSHRHFVYDYARTVYGVQGKTNKSVLALMTSWRRNTTHQRSFMVSVTRASHNVKLFVDAIGKVKDSLYRRTGDNAEALTKPEFEAQKMHVPRIEPDKPGPKITRI